jgi:ketosteroid isomerase-like protein
MIIDEFLIPVRGMFEDGDPKVSIVDLISKMVALETRGLGRLKNGKAYDNVYSSVITVESNKIREISEYPDSYYVNTQM